MIFTANILCIAVATRFEISSVTVVADFSPFLAGSRPLPMTFDPAGLRPEGSHDLSAANRGACHGAELDSSGLFLAARGGNGGGGSPVPEGRDETWRRRGWGGLEG